MGFGNVGGRMGGGKLFFFKFASINLTLRRLNIPHLNMISKFGIKTISSMFSGMDNFGGMNMDRFGSSGMGRMNGKFGLRLTKHS